MGSHTKMISDKIKQFSLQSPFDSDRIETLLQYLSSLGIDSYDFTFGANMASRTINKEITSELEKYLMEFEEGKEGTCICNAFSAYYLLSYYYREYEKMAQLQELINKYEVYFIDYYALTYQVHGRLWRRKGYCKQALECDKRAMAKLAEKNINNLGVRITYASTVSIALENKDDSIQEEDISESVEAIEEAIALNSKYAKYSYLKAKIMMFRLTFGVDNYDYSECAKQVSIAKELLRTAIEYEDEKSDSYMHHIIDYKSYMREADLILAEIRTLILIKKQSEQSVAASDAFKKTLQEVKNAEEKIYQTQNTLNERMLEIQSTLNERLYEVQNSVDEKLHQTQNHFLELLALFVSVVSIIMVAVGMLSKQFTILQTIFAIIIMNVCAVAVYSSFLMLLHDKLVTRHMVALVLCIIIVCVVIAFLFYLDPVCSL